MKIRKTILALGLVSAAIVTAPAFAEDDPSPQPVQTREQQQKRAAEILRQMLPPEMAGTMNSKPKADGFGSEMGRLAFENAYMQLWTRPGLGLKERSLITISMLIAMGNEKELAIHMASGLRNGMTPQELEEVVYHASAYVGFPLASDALAIATEVVAQENAKGK